MDKKPEESDMLISWHESVDNQKHNTEEQKIQKPSLRSHWLILSVRPTSDVRHLFYVEVPRGKDIPTVRYETSRLSPDDMFREVKHLIRVKLSPNPTYILADRAGPVPTKHRYIGCRDNAYVVRKYNRIP